MSDPTPALTPPCPKPISVALARALAEAADGYPGYTAAFFVASYTLVDTPRGFNIQGPFTTWEEARDWQSEVTGGAYGFFGPFDTTASIRAEGERVAVIEIRLSDGRTFEFSATRTDALFFSASSVEKFALPYYERIYGPAYAQEVMAQFRYTSVQVMAHFPWSEYTDGPPKPPDAAASGPMFLRRDAGGGPTLVPAGGSVMPLRPLRPS